MTRLLHLLQLGQDLVARLVINAILKEELIDTLVSASRLAKAALLFAEAGGLVRLNLTDVLRNVDLVLDKHLLDLLIGVEIFLFVVVV
jgi:hypothetical protein